MGGSIQGIPLSLNGVVTTLAGTAGAIGSADGTGAAAKFYWPSGITTDGQELYVGDCLNHTFALSQLNKIDDGISVLSARRR